MKRNTFDLSIRNKRTPRKKTKKKNTKHDYQLYFHKARPTNKPMKKRLAKMLCSKLTCNNIAFGQKYCGSCQASLDERDTNLTHSLPSKL
jgi:hypothetical protein